MFARAAPRSLIYSRASASWTTLFRGGLSGLASSAIKVDIGVSDATEIGARIQFMQPAFIRFADAGMADSAVRSGVPDESEAIQRGYQAAKGG